MRSPISRTRRPARTLWRQVVVTIGAVLGTLFLVVAVAGVFAGVKPLVFTSGSMEPQISTGALAFARETPAAELRSGDVVSVLDEQGVRVTHRVVSAEPAAGSTSTSLVLRGDANASADLRPYVVDSGDRVLFDVPLVGYAVTWLSSPAGLACVGLLLGLVLIAAFSKSQRPQHLRVRARRRFSRGALVLCVLGASTQASLALTATQAFWTDTAAATSGTFSALASIPAPSSPLCTEDGTHVDGAWTAPATNPSRYRYEISANRADNGAQVGSDVFYAGSPSHLPWTDFAATSAFTATGKYNFTYRVSTAALNSATWLSPSYIEIPFHFSAARDDIDCGHDLSTAVAITSLGTDSGTAGDYVTNVASNTISGTSTPGDASTIVIKRGGTQIATATANPTTGAWTSTSFTLTNGSQTLTAEATDYVGNTASASRAVELDTATAVAITSLGTDTGDSSTDYKTRTASNTISGTSTPGDRSTIVIKRGGTQIATATANVTTGAWTSSAFTLTEANQTITAESTDDAGNTATASQVVMLDTVNPTGSLTTPNGTTCNAKAGCGTVSDALSGLSGGTATSATKWLLVRTLTSSGATQCYVGSGYVNCSSPNFVAYAASQSGGSAATFQAAAPYEKLNGYTYRTTFQVYDVVGNMATGSVTW